MSTRRFFWRPSAVLLVATGWLSPLPMVVIFEAGMPLLTRYSLTAAARRSERRWLYLSVPIESVWPVAITISRSTPLILARASSMDFLPSGRTTDLSKSNSASAWITIDWRAAVGAGLAGSAGLGAGAGAAGAAGSAGLAGAAGAAFTPAHSG